MNRNELENKLSEVPYWHDGECVGTNEDIINEILAAFAAQEKKIEALKRVMEKAETYVTTMGTTEFYELKSAVKEAREALDEQE